MLELTTTASPTVSDSNAHGTETASFDFTALLDTFAERQSLEASLPTELTDAELRDRVFSDLTYVPDYGEQEFADLRERVFSDLTHVPDPAEQEFSALRERVFSDLTDVPDPAEPEFADLRDRVFSDLINVPDPAEPEFADLRDRVFSDLTNVPDPAEPERASPSPATPETQPQIPDTPPSPPSSSPTEPPPSGDDLDAGLPSGVTLGAGGSAPSMGATPPAPSQRPEPSTTPPTSSPVSEQELGVILADLLGEEDAPPTGGENAALPAAPPTPEEVGVPSSDDALDDMQDVLDGVQASGDDDGVDEEDDAETPPPPATGGSERPNPDGDQQPLDMDYGSRGSPVFIPSQPYAMRPNPDGDEPVMLYFDPGSRPTMVYTPQQQGAIRPLPIEIDDTYYGGMPTTPNYNGSAGAIRPVLNEIAEPALAGGNLVSPLINPDLTLTIDELDRLGLG